MSVGSRTFPAHKWEVMTMPGEREIPEVQPAYPAAGAAGYRTVYVERQPSFFRRLWGWAFRTLFLVSLLLNVFLLVIVLPDATGRSTLSEKTYSGKATASDKIAIVHIDGTLMEGLLSYPRQQIRSAAKDKKVKAVVISINSPGGTVTASDQLYKQIIDLRDGKWPGQEFGKPIVVHMGSVAASGGYYIAVPAKSIIAEPTTITGSIGVYAPLLDISKLAADYGIKMTIIKKGELKASGSMFKQLTPEERRQFDEMLEYTYQRFMHIVRDGRKGRLKYDLRDEIRVPSLTQPEETYVRRLADGGVFTSAQAKEFGLIDQIGYLQDAIDEAVKLAGVSDYRVIEYQRPLSLADALLGIEAEPPERSFRLSDVPGVTRRLWYLAPGHDFAGVRLPAELLRQ